VALVIAGTLSQRDVPGGRYLRAHIGTLHRKQPHVVFLRSLPDVALVVTERHPRISASRAA